MTDIFGSIIAIAVSVAVVLIFRQIDKNNRSLEKVKKYTDKIKSDLDVYFSEQKEKLDNVAVNLKVEQQKALATISRLNEQYDEFNNRASSLSDHTSSVDSIRDRISAYDSSLKELMEMTARIEENLESLHKESSFVTSISKKIDIQRDRLDAVEKQIPSLQKEFDKINKEHLDSASIATINKFEERAAQLESSFTQKASELDVSFTTQSESVISTFTQKVSELKSETSEVAQKSAELLDEINQSIAHAYEEAANKADKLEGDIFTSLNQKAQQREDAFATKAEERFNQLNDTLSTQLSSFEESVQNTQERYEEIVNQIDDKCNEYEKEARSVATRFDNELANTQGILTELKNEVEQKTSNISSYLDDVLKQAASDSLELGKKASETFNTQFTQHLEELETELSEKLQSGLTESNTAINQGLAETNQSLATGLAQTNTAINQGLAETNRSLETGLAEVNTAINQGLDETNKALETGLEETNTAINQGLAETNKSLTDGLTASNAAINQGLTAANQLLVTSLAETNQSIESQLAEAKQSLEEEFARIKDLLEQKLSNTNQSVTGGISALNNEIATTITQLHDNISMDIQKVQSFAEAGLAETNQSLEAGLAQANQSVETGLAQTNQSIEAGLAQTNQSIEAGLVEVKQSFEQELAQTKELLDKELLNTNQSTTNGLAALNTEVTTAIEELHNNISVDIQKVQSFAESGYNEWQKKSEDLINKYQIENAKLQEAYTASSVDIINKFDAIEQNVNETTNRIEEKTAANNAKLLEIEAIVEQKSSDIINRMDNAYEMAAKRVTELESGAYKQFTELSESRQAQNKADFDAQLETLQSTMQESFDILKKKLLNDSESTKALAEKYKNEWSEQASQLLESFTSEVNKNSNVYTQTVKEIDERFSAYDIETKNQTEQISETISGNANTLTELKKSFSEEITAVSAKLENKLSEALVNHDKASSAFFAQMETQLDAYKEDMNYRYERLDNASGELDNLEKNFRRAMNETEERVNLDFQTFIRNQQTTQNDFERNIQGQSDEISKHIQSLEGELNELKKRAYDNVSEKLKVFEEDFAADLLKRGNAIDASFTDWKTTFDSRLDNTVVEAEAARKELESQYNENLKNELSTLQERSREQIAHFEELLTAANSSVQSRFDNCDVTLKSFIEQYHVDLDNAKASADLYLKKELESETEVINRELSKFERDITARLESVNGQVEESNNMTDGVVKGIMADLSSWQERVNLQFEETKTMFSSKLTALEQSSSELITQVQNAFETDVNGFFTQSQEERNLLSTQLEQVKEASAKSISDYESRCSGLIDSFKKAYNDMAEDSQKRLRDQTVDTEQKLRALRALVQEIREKNEESQEKMVLKMQGDANKLNTTMDDIDDRLNQFIAQTRIFDKAEELRVNLENQIENLKTEITKVESFREEAATVSQQFARINKMEDELSLKLQHFNEEKKHLDELENDFCKLVALSDSMDTKILELQTTNDDVQNMQVQIRNMMKVVADGSVKFERLEKKLPVLDQTAADVDQSFEHLKQLENRLDACTSMTEQFPVQLSDVKNDVERLLNNTARVSDVVAKLESLDAILGNTENRIKEVEKSRDWIARTETRLQEISDKAEKEVKLIGELVKTPQDRQRDNKGAPPEATRENVIKLLHGGWKPEEIAKRLNLSLGEVELIQDFYDRGNV